MWLDPSRPTAVRTLAASLALVLAFLVVPWHPAASAVPTVDAQRAAEALAVRLVGDARVAAGLRPLRADPAVEAIARARAVDMRTRGYFGHTSPDGATAFDLLDRAGVAWQAASEAIGWNDVRDVDGSAARIVADWLASPEHRDILLATDRDRIGIAVAADSASGRFTWVAVLIAALAPALPPVAVRVVRLGGQDGSGRRIATLAWTARASRSAAVLPVVSVTVQVRPAGGRWATVARTARRTIRVRVRAPAAFDVRVQPRGPAGVLGPWTVVRVRP